MFKERLRQLRRAAGYTQSELACQFELAQATVANWEAGAREPDFSMACRLAAFFRVTVDYLLGMSDLPNPSPEAGVRIPVLGYVQAGLLTEAIEDPDGYEEISPSLAQTGDFFALRIRGDSMEPRFVEDDVVIVRRQPDVESGDIAVVLAENEDATVKKIIKQRGGIFLMALNPAYPPRFFSNKEIIQLPVEILGRVVELRAHSI